MRLDILVCADHKFVMPCGVTLHSLCKNNQDSCLHIHLISDTSLEQSDIDDLTQIVREYNASNFLSIYRVSDEMMAPHAWYKDSYYPKQVFYRLFCSELLPEDIDRILYIDCDTIIRKSIAPLWDLDLTNFGAAVCPDASETGRRLGFTDEDVYFNSGVMLINLDYWRRQDCQAELFKYIDSHRDIIKLPDQDPLNVIFKDKKQHLNISYNLQPIALYKDKYITFPWRKYEQELRRAQRNPVIIHYAGARPWEKGCKHPYKEVWQVYKKQTKWADIPMSPSRISFKRRCINFLRILLTPFGICHYVFDYYNRELSLSD